MAEEENNQNEETPEAEETPAEETPAEEPAPEQEAVPEQDAAIESEEQPSEDEDAGASDEAASAEEPAATSAPEPDTGEAQPQRSAEERAQERAQVRSAKATGRRRRRGQERAKSGDSRPGTPPAERVEGTKKVQFGTVVSDKADKTITVRVDIVRRHRRYEKVVRQSATIHAHDERNEAAEGDVVRVIESRPLSRTKRWRLVEVVEKAPVRT
jgi:small subunit ribosomal protein S17